MAPLTDAEKLAAWNALEATLTELVPDWNDQSNGVRSISDCAKMALRRMHSAAEWGEYSTHRHHVSNECVVAKRLLEHPDFPESLRPEMQAHLMRMRRLA